MKRLSWIEILLLPVTMAALTTCWLAPWMRWLALAAGLGPERVVAPWLMVLVLIIGALVTRWAVAATHSNLQLQRPQRIIAAGGLTTIVGVLWITFGRRFPVDYLYNLTEWGQPFSAEVLALAVTVFLWWRAIRIGRDDDLHATAQREFSGGVVALTILFVLNKINPRLTTSDAFWPTFGFFAVGLGALAVAGFEQDRRIQKSITGTGLGVSRQWLGTVAALIGCILAGGVLVAAIADPTSLTALTAVLDAVGVILVTVIGFAVYILTILLLPIAEILARALNPLLELLFNISLNVSNLGLSIPTPEEIATAAQQLARTQPFRIIEIIVILTIIGLIFVLAVRRFRLFANLNSADEVHESIFSRELLWNQLKGLFQRRTPELAAAGPPYLSLTGPTDDPRLIVRRAYQALLERAGSRELVRAPGQTPRAYAGRLSAAWPQVADAITTLTEIYIQARYSQQISAADAERAQHLLEQLADSRLPQLPVAPSNNSA